MRKRIEFVPVVCSDIRRRGDRWTDDRYLIDCEGVGSNAVYISEVLDALRAVRAAADTAKTPDFLAGCNVGIAAINRLLTVSATAKMIREKKIALREVDGEPV